MNCRLQPLLQTARLAHLQHIPPLRTISAVFATKTHLRIRTMSSLWSSDQGELINLGKGHPNPSLLPLSDLRKAFEIATSRPDAKQQLMQYGRMQGNDNFCKEIAAWLTRGASRDPPVDPEHIFITNGAGPALSVVCQLFTKPGDTIFVDCPGYFLSYYAFKDCKLKIVQIPTDEHGIDVDFMKGLLENGTRASMVYTVPIANNPTGVNLSTERKQQLGDLSRQYDFKIVADEVYQFLCFDGVPQSLIEFDDAEHPTVISIGSFSKLLGPGLRLGWIETHSSHVARLLQYGAVQSGGGLNPLTSGAVLEMMRNGSFQTQIDKTLTKYRETAKVLCTSIDELMRPALRPGENLSYEMPMGGFFCFVSLPERFDTEKLLEKAKNEFGVSYFAGRHFSAEKNMFKNSLRVCFAFLEADVIKEGVQRLANAIAAY